MRGNALIFMKYLDCPTGNTYPDLGLQQGVGRRVIMPIDLDVVVEPHLAAAPFREFVWFQRKRLEDVAFDLFEQLPAAGSKVAGAPVV